MENNKKIRDLYELYIELGHDAFEEIIKPMGVCSHNSDGNAISMIVMQIKFHRFFISLQKHHDQFQDKFYKAL